jgi:hypothetical protein
MAANNKAEATFLIYAFIGLERFNGGTDRAKLTTWSKLCNLFNVVALNLRLTLVVLPTLALSSWLHRPIATALAWAGLGWAVVSWGQTRPAPAPAFAYVRAEQGVLWWQIRNEPPLGQYYVETWKNQNWQAENVVAIAPDKNATYGQTLYFQSGLNRYRVRLDAPAVPSLVSSVVEFESPNEFIKVFPLNVADYLYFSKPVQYQITLATGQAVLKGYAKVVDCRPLSPGLYWVQFGNRREKFLKKQPLPSPLGAGQPNRHEKNHRGHRWLLGLR